MLVCYVLDLDLLDSLKVNCNFLCLNTHSHGFPAITSEGTLPVCSISMRKSFEEKGEFDMDAEGYEIVGQIIRYQTLSDLKPCDLLVSIFDINAFN